MLLALGGGSNRAQNLKINKTIALMFVCQTTVTTLSLQDPTDYVNAVHGQYVYTAIDIELITNDN